MGDIENLLVLVCLWLGAMLVVELGLRIISLCRQSSPHRARFTKGGAEAHIANLIWALEKKAESLTPVNCFSREAIEIEAQLALLERLLVHWGMRP